MKKYWGEEMVDINYNTLKHVVIELLAKKPIPLTGNEVRFIRQYFKMNYFNNNLFCNPSLQNSIIVLTTSKCKTHLLCHRHLP